MRQGEFVEVVDVCYTEVERGGEDKGGCCGSRVDKHVQWKQKGAEEKFLIGRPSDKIAPADPAA